MQGILLEPKSTASIDRDEYTQLSIFLERLERWQAEYSFYTDPNA